MAINLYCGWPGSGKSYEVVSQVIVPALAQGRRVVTNVAGLSDAKIAAYVASEVWKGQGGDLGELVHVTNSQISGAGFWESEKHGADFALAEGAIVKPGDLVVIDEAANFFGDSFQAAPVHGRFMREHRHFVNAAGASCDLVLVAQDPALLHRNCRALVELTCRMVKLKRVGFHKRFRVEVFEGVPSSRNKPHSVLQKKYDKRIFPLYESYKGGVGQEVTVDKRQNMLRGSRFIYAMPLALVLVGFAGWKGYRFFHPAQPVGKPLGDGVMNPSPVNKKGVVPMGGEHLTQAPGRLIGYAQVGGRRVFLVDTGGGGVEVVDAPDAFALAAYGGDVTVNGVKYVSRSVVVAKSNVPVAVVKPK